MQIPNFSLTPKQVEARDMMAGPQKHSLLFGGSRSAKTFTMCYCTATRVALRK